MNRDCDFLVIGTGIAGLSYALKVAPYGRVILVTKSLLSDTNTYHAQGGIASVTCSPDDFEQHITDTMLCGSNKSDREVVEMVVRNAPTQIEQLANWGVSFDRTEDGSYSLAREGGHSQHRVLHHKDFTGAEIEDRLIDLVKKIPTSRYWSATLPLTCSLSTIWVSSSSVHCPARSATVPICSSSTPAM